VFPENAKNYKMISQNPATKIFNRTENFKIQFSVLKMKILFAKLIRNFKKQNHFCKNPAVISRTKNIFQNFFSD